MPINPPQDLVRRFNELHETLRLYAQDPRREPELLAVSKGQSADRIRELFSLGQRRFGENYVQELLAKAEELSDLPIEWVYIGHLQSNKIKKLLTVVDEIQTLADWGHAKALARHLRETPREAFKVFLEVKVDANDSKSGRDWGEVQELCKRIQAELPELRVLGLMAIPSSSYSDDLYPEIPELYRQLREWANGIGEGRLSLGMSGDMRIALAAGTDVLRIGQALMGARKSVAPSQKGDTASPS